MMVISLRSESSCEEEHVGVLKGGAMLSFQSYISGLLQCEKISEVLWMSFQEQQRFSLVLCSK
ncbi:hypothetical protein YC2023_017267 [Brassica napus]